VNDMIIDGVAVIGAIACVMWLIRGLKALQSGASTQSEDAVEAVPAEVSASIVDDDIAVIAAAVYAMLGRRHIVHIDSHLDPTWASEGRWMHQISHTPH